MALEFALSICLRSRVPSYVSQHEDNGHNIVMYVLTKSITQVWNLMSNICDSIYHSNLLIALTKL